MTSPTQRTLAECKKRGWIAQVVEKWNPHARVRQDLFGCIDIVAIVPDAGCAEERVSGKCCGQMCEQYQRSTVIGIQACAGSSHATRRAKVLAEPRIKAWIDAGARFEIWSWSKKGKRGKAKRWELREEQVK